jgi:hypothetical protein
MYSLAMEIPVSDVKICLNTQHLYLSEPLGKVQVFDTILVQVGPSQDDVLNSPSDSQEYEEQPLPPLALTLTTPKGKPVLYPLVSFVITSLKYFQSCQKTQYTLENTESDDSR